MAGSARGKRKAGFDIIRFEVGMFFEDLFRTHPGSEEFQHVRYANPHTAHTRLAATFTRLGGDSLQ